MSETLENKDCKKEITGVAGDTETGVAGCGELLDEIAPVFAPIAKALEEEIEKSKIFNQGDFRIEISDSHSSLVTPSLNFADMTKSDNIAMKVEAKKEEVITGTKVYKNLPKAVQKKLSQQPNQQSFAPGLRGICEKLIQFKNEHNSIASKYIKSIRDNEEDLIPVLLETPYRNSLGYVSAYNRMVFDITDKDFYEVEKYCIKNGYQVEEFIEKKTVYRVTPQFRRAYGNKTDVFFPYVEKIKKTIYSYLKIQLSI